MSDGLAEEYNVFQNICPRSIDFVPIVCTLQEILLGGEIKEDERNM
jgi:hypothetical protein